MQAPDKRRRQPVAPLSNPSITFCGHFAFYLLAARASELSLGRATVSWDSPPGSSALASSVGAARFKFRALGSRPSLSRSQTLADSRTLELEGVISEPRERERQQVSARRASKSRQPSSKLLHLGRASGSPFFARQSRRLVALFALVSFARRPASLPFFTD